MQIWVSAVKRPVGGSICTHDTYPRCSLSLPLVKPRLVYWGILIGTIPVEASHLKWPATPWWNSRRCLSSDVGPLIFVTLMGIKPTPLSDLRTLFFFRWSWHFHVLVQLQHLQQVMEGNVIGRPSFCGAAKISIGDLAPEPTSEVGTATGPVPWFFGTSGSHWFSCFWLFF